LGLAVQESDDLVRRAPPDLEKETDRILELAMNQNDY